MRFDPAPKARPPRPHQSAAIAAAKAHFVSGGAARGRLIMPCGTGKSLTAYWIAEALEAKTILVAVCMLLPRMAGLEWVTGSGPALSRRTYVNIDPSKKPALLCVTSD